MHWEIRLFPNVIFEQDHEIHRIQREIYGNLGNSSFKPKVGDDTDDI